MVVLQILQHIFRPGSAIQLELLPRPSRHDAYRGGWRKTVALRAAVEIHLDRHTLTLVDVDVRMPVRLQDFGNQKRATNWRCKRVLAIALFKVMQCGQLTCGGHFKNRSIAESTAEIGRAKDSAVAGLNQPGLSTAVSRQLNRVFRVA